MVKPRQILYDVNHLGFIYYILKNLLPNNIFKFKQVSWYEIFQEKFFKFSKIKYVIPLSRARLGIYLYLKEIIKENKNEVLLSPFTIFDVVNMVICAGGKPVFVDIKQKNDLSLHPDDLKKSINKKTCCIFLTHYHFNNNKLKTLRELCKDNDIKIMEDCAISLGSMDNNQHVGFRSDASIFSFSLFKFISVYQGGALYIRDIKLRNKITNEISKYQTFSISEMLVYALKGLKFSFLTNRFCYQFIFLIIRFGYKNNIKIIKDNVKNDPNPFSRKNIPKYFLRKVNHFQLKEFSRQLKNINFYREKRTENFFYYNSKLCLYQNLSNHCQSFLNYPIVFKSKFYKGLFINFIMKKNFDIGEYYYRSCNAEEVFNKFKKDCPNSEHFSKCVVTLPTHYLINRQYINLLCDSIKEFLQIYPDCII